MLDQKLCQPLRRRSTVEIEKESLPKNWPDCTKKQVGVCL